MLTLPNTSLADRPNGANTTAPTAATAHATPDQHRTKRLRSSYNSIVKVIVGLGDAQEIFYVYEDIVKERSKFFKAALSKDWLENQQKIVELPSQQPEIFGMYLECLYHAAAVNFAILSGMTVLENKVTDKDKGVSAFRRLFRLWITADFLGDMQLANEVIDGIIYCSDTYSAFAISYASMTANFTNTVAGSALCRWTVDWWSAGLQPETVAAYTDDIPHGLVVLLLKKVVENAIQGKKMAFPKLEERVQYHT